MYVYSYVCLGYCVFDSSIIQLCKSSHRPHKFSKRNSADTQKIARKRCVISLFLIEQQQQYLVFNIPFNMRKVVQILEILQ